MTDDMVLIICVTIMFVTAWIGALVYNAYVVSKESAKVPKDAEQAIEMWYRQLEINAELLSRLEEAQKSEVRK